MVASVNNNTHDYVTDSPVTLYLIKLQLQLYRIQQVYSIKFLCNHDVTMITSCGHVIDYFTT